MNTEAEKVGKCVRGSVNKTAFKGVRALSVSIRVHLWFHECRLWLLPARRKRFCCLLDFQNEGFYIPCFFRMQRMLRNEHMGTASPEIPGCFSGCRQLRHTAGGFV